VPPYVRKSRSLEAALPWLYLKGDKDMQALPEGSATIDNKIEKFWFADKIIREPYQDLATP